jgi:hypothetical protein
MKLCFRCFTVIPALASKCPNCLDQRQGTWGRIIFLVLAVAAMFWLLDRCADKRWPFEHGRFQLWTEGRR